MGDPCDEAFSIRPADPGRRISVQTDSGCRETQGSESALPHLGQGTYCRQCAASTKGPTVSKGLHNQLVTVPAAASLTHPDQQPATFLRPTYVDKETAGLPCLGPSVRDSPMSVVPPT
ncbi:hypothetical protein MRX96_020301 [Rhipicephalus microplus]